jgi:hypothetical protein
MPARQYYRDHPLSVGAQVRDLADSQRATALQLLEDMLDPSAVAS